MTFTYCMLLSDPSKVSTWCTKPIVTDGGPKPNVIRTDLKQIVADNKPSHVTTCCFKRDLKVPTFFPFRIISVTHLHIQIYLGEYVHRCRRLGCEKVDNYSILPCTNRNDAYEIAYFGVCLIVNFT